MGKPICQTFFMHYSWLSSCRYCVDHAQIQQGPAPDNVLIVLQISSKSIHFQQRNARLIAEHVNTAKMCRKVNPIFGWSLSSSRIINITAAAAAAAAKTAATVRGWYTSDNSRSAADELEPVVEKRRSTADKPHRYRHDNRRSGNVASISSFCRELFCGTPWHSSNVRSSIERIFIISACVYFSNWILIRLLFLQQ